MIITFHGTRGSIPICDPKFQEFGGNTTCVSVSSEEEGDSILIFDAGTGIRNLGKELAQKNFADGNKIYMTFSHFHWDHIQGFPFFAPAYMPNKEIEFFLIGKDAPDAATLEEILSKQTESIYFPIPLNKMGASFAFTVDNNDVIDIGGGTLSVNKHQHPGGAFAYRVEVNGKVMVYCTDIEHGDTIDQKVVEFSKDADVLIHEAQYTPEELLSHKGWGHSSWEQAIEVAKLANVKNLYLTHHDPDHDDEFLRQMEKECQEHFTNCFVAREGQKVIL